MITVKRAFSFDSPDAGASLVEYMLLLSLVVLVALLALTELSDVVGGQFSFIGSSLSEAFN
jgi:Flp pilus assembly pilin Flp